MVVRHLERQIKNDAPMKNVVLDHSYNTGAVHCGLEFLVITGYISTFQFSNFPEKYGVSYLPQEDAFFVQKESDLCTIDYITVR